MQTIVRSSKNKHCKYRFEKLNNTINLVQYADKKI